MKQGGHVFGGLFVSVPLSGLVSVNACTKISWNGCVITVSVPLSGLVSVNDNEKKTGQYITKGFRPLIGVSFCKQ